MIIWNFDLQSMDYLNLVETEKPVSTNGMVLEEINYIVMILVMWQKFVQRVALNAAMLLGAGIEAFPGPDVFPEPAILLPFPASSAAADIFLKDSNSLMSIF